MLANPLQVQAAIDPVLSALQSLATALFNRDNVLKVPGADGLSASTIQGVRQQIALVQQRITQVQATLADFAKIPAAVNAAKDVLQKLTPVLVSPDALRTLIDNGQLGPLLTALNTSLGGFGTALSPLMLIEGTIKKTLLGVVDTLGDVLVAVDKLLPIIESLIGDEIVVRFGLGQAHAGPLATGHRPPAVCAGQPVQAERPKGVCGGGGGQGQKERRRPRGQCALRAQPLRPQPAGRQRRRLHEARIREDRVHRRLLAQDQCGRGLLGIHFIGVLSFVEALRDLIPLDGFSDPPALTVDEHGIDASFSVALPNLAVGVMSLTNLSLGAGFTVPFIGQPLSVRFNFCTREAPFNLTVSLFGGGGFFGISIDPHGVQKLEAVRVRGGHCH